eukprot:CAMPEP_0115857214 /NCGR_PEP_ID=MMETSP0287-20121206/15459_1 /TAXON_ID=412157 /ORGANISM="Chrysochromulina rotalis, Strain UIO044" /LENGTH=30 /DNA_ID= /DNA_START= /DNA_END= /DNA_ORIENTATION=
MSSAEKPDEECTALTACCAAWWASTAPPDA